MLRPYQQKAAESALDWMRKTLAPGCIEAATGAGKSHIIAEVARVIHQQTDKRVLCLAPSAELVTQNREKFLASGHRASMFSASAGAKELRYPVVFGSPLTVKNRISAFKKSGRDGYALVVIDEAHGLTPTVKGIIEEMRDANPNLRVLGLTATPYRLGLGWIFREHADGKINGDDTAREPYFAKCVALINARELIDAGYLAKPVIGTINAAGYDTAGLSVNARGQFDAEAVDRAYHGHGRKTGAIVADVVAQSRGRRGVMLFAATVQHAREIMASLPPELSVMAAGDANMGGQARKTVVRDIKAQRVKYFVSVGGFTTGFDASHIDVIAILRKTESVGLLQQIIGRGLRISEGKTDCLILDYTSNLEDHCPDGDLFAPVVRAGKGPGDGGGMTCVCPSCAHENQFTANPQYLKYNKDEAGYALDLEGRQLMSEFGPIAAHYGRRCMGLVQSGKRGEYERCGYRWTFKECPHCEAENDIAARYCVTCKGEIVDPNEKLRADFKEMKKDPTQMQTDKVLQMTFSEGTSQKGNRTFRVNFVTPYRQFTVWLSPDSKARSIKARYESWATVTDSGALVPSTVSYRKDPHTQFFEVHAYNREADVAPV